MITDNTTTKIVSKVQRNSEDKDTFNKHLYWTNAKWTQNIPVNFGTD